MAPKSPAPGIPISPTSRHPRLPLTYHDIHQSNIIAKCQNMEDEIKSQLEHKSIYIPPRPLSPSRQHSHIFGQTKFPSDITHTNHPSGSGSGSSSSSGIESHDRNINLDPTSNSNSNSFLLLRSPSPPPLFSNQLPKRRLSFSSFSKYPPPKIKITPCSSDFDFKVSNNNGVLTSRIPNLRIFNTPIFILCLLLFILLSFSHTLSSASVSGSVVLGRSHGRMLAIKGRVMSHLKDIGYKTGEEPSGEFSKHGLDLVGDGDLLGIGLGSVKTSQRVKNGFEGYSAVISQNSESQNVDNNRPVPREKFIKAIPPPHLFPEDLAQSIDAASHHSAHPRFIPLDQIKTQPTAPPIHNKPRAPAPSSTTSVFSDANHYRNTTAVKPDSDGDDSNGDNSGGNSNNNSPSGGSTGSPESGTTGPAGINSGNNGAAAAPPSSNSSQSSRRRWGSRDRRRGRDEIDAFGP